MLSEAKHLHRRPVATASPRARDREDSIRERAASPLGRWLSVGALVLAPLLSLALAADAPAQEGKSRDRWIVQPSGAIAFPTGRFGEKDALSDPKKDGHKTGYSGGVEIGYFLGNHLAAGLAFDYSRFPLDFAVPIDQDGHTSVLFGQVWVKQFFPRGFAHWRPYVLLGAGLGRPKGRVDYPYPIPIDTFSVSTMESTVGMAFGGTGAIGVWMPASPRIGASFEACYHTISTKGTERSDKFLLADGSSVEFKYGSGVDGDFRLRAKSNTNWWEIRVGLVATFP